MSKKSLFLLILAATAILIIAALFRFSWMFKLVTIPRLVELVDHARAHFWLSALFYIFFVVGVMGLPITLFPIIGGVLFEFWIALPLNVLAATAGAYASFSVTRFLGWESLHRIIRDRLKMLDYITSKEGFKSVLFLRLIGIPPFIVTNYALGLSNVRKKDFLLGTMFGILPWMSIVTYAAHSLWTAVLTGGQKGLRHALFELVAPLSVLSVLILITSVVTSITKNKMNSQKKDG